MAESSDWGFASTTVEAVQALGSSGWGRAVTILAAPIAPQSGRWGAAVHRLRAPHRPVAVETSTGLKHSRLRIWTGTELR